MTAARDQDIATLAIDRSALPRRRRRPGRWIAAAAALLVVVAVLWRTVLAPVTAVATATATRVFPAQAFTALNASGYVVAQRRAAVASKATGRLVWLGVEEGSPVKAGQVIARLEREDLDAALAQARASRASAAAAREGERARRDAAAAALENAQAQRAVAAAGVEQALAEVDDAATALARERGLFERGMTAKAALDAAATRARKADALLVAARATLAAAGGALRAAEESLAAAEAAVAAAGHAVEAAGAAVRAAEVGAGQAEIRAPFDGVVLTKNAEVGDMVTPLGSAANARAAVVTIADPASLLVEADVAETSLAKVRVGQPCEVLLDAVPGARFPAVVHMIVPTADRAKGTVLAKVRFAALDPRILPEMSAKVAFLERAVAPGEETPRVAVPPRALADRGGRPVVFAVKDGRAAATAVRPGARLGDLVEITDGLAGGERVVLDPPTRLRDGARVSVAEP